MKKDSYYFPHFCNARHDRKIRRVKKELGLEGYGIFFSLLEILREQSDFRYPTADIDLIADEIGTSEQKVRTVICNYDLFVIDDNEKFFSPKLVLYLQPYLEKSERARLAAQKRWKKIEDANAMQMHSKCNADQNASKVKESKVNKSKGESEQAPPSPPKKKKQVEKEKLTSKIALTSREKEKLVDQVGPDEFAHLLKICTNWLEANNQTRKDCYRFLLNWISKDYYKPKYAKKEKPKITKWICRKCGGTKHVGGVCKNCYEAMEKVE